MLFVQVVDRSGRIVARSSGARRARAGRRRARCCATASRGCRTARSGPTRCGSTPRRSGELGRGEAAGGAVIVAGRLAEIERTLDHTRRLVALCALVAGAARGRAGDAADPPRPASADAAVVRRAGDRALRRRRRSGSRSRAMRDEVGELADTLNAMLASLETRPGGRASLRRRRLARAAHAADRAARQRRLHRPPRRRRGGRWPTSRPAPSGSRELLDDLLALAREDAAAPPRGEPVRARRSWRRAPTRS